MWLFLFPSAWLYWQALLCVAAGLTTQQLAGMMTNSGSYYNMTMGNITGSGYPSSYPSSYPSGSGPPLDNTIGTGSGFPGGMGSGFPGGMGSGSPGSYPSVGTTPPPQLPGGMTGNTGAYKCVGMWEEYSLCVHVWVDMQLFHNAHTLYLETWKYFPEQIECHKKKKINHM